MGASHGFVWRSEQKLSNDLLVDLLSGPALGEQKIWYLVTCVTDREFDDFKGAQAPELVEKWTQGRVFSDKCEIRWRRAWDAQSNDVLVLCEEESLKPEGFSLVSERFYIRSFKEGAVMKTWLEDYSNNTPTRLPRSLSYPEGCEKGRIDCLHYCAQSGEAQFIRLKGVI